MASKRFYTKRISGLFGYSAWVYAKYLLDGKAVTVIDCTISLYLSIVYNKIYLLVVFSKNTTIPEFFNRYKLILPGNQ